MSKSPVKIVSIMWNSYIPTLLEAAGNCPGVSLSLFSNKEMSLSDDVIERFFEAMKTADVFLFHYTNDDFWGEVEARLSDFKGDCPVITMSYDPVNWSRLGSKDLSASAAAYAYITNGGLENSRRLLNFIANRIDKEILIEEPVELPWQGILYPGDPNVYDTIEEYRAAHPACGKNTIGILFSRHTFTNTNGALEGSLVKALEKRGLDVLPVFSQHAADPQAGIPGALATAERYFLDENGKSRVNALINLQFFFLGTKKGADLSETGTAKSTVHLLKRLNIPVFKPVIAYGLTVSEWEESPQGLISDVTFGLAMPEFEGNIEPIIMAASAKREDPRTGTVWEEREIIAERLEKTAERISRWMRLLEKPVSERKVVFILHKNECAGLEASIGGAGGLDTGESIVAIFRRMKEAGYSIENIPGSGEELFQTILAKKAIAEFRWTTVDEIVTKGGHICLLSAETYQGWYEKLPEKNRKQLAASWGEPPGTELNGVPPAMIYENQIVITGLPFGNAAVMMQPKRGCAGSRCDGQVCKILHDPELAPPHQYVATYMYMDKIFGADFIVHVGTHGNVEWLPGKGAGLSKTCWPDVCLGVMPHLYIYNADNPAEGVVAKRRGNAVLLSHMQAVMTTSDTYGDLLELENLLDEHHRAAGIDPARAHQIEHLIMDAVEKNHMTAEVEKTSGPDFTSKVRRIHEILSRVRNSQTVAGMHTFGKMQKMDERAETINTILRFDSANELNTRRLIFDLWGENLDSALDDPAGRSEISGKVMGELLYAADRAANELILGFIRGDDQDGLFNAIAEKEGLKPDVPERFLKFAALVKDINERILESKEIDNLLNAANAGYVEAGPSGFISRGRHDVLPTGRNFYNVDPTRIPTKAACRVGIRLAEALIEKHVHEEGREPEKIGMVWFASDIMRSDGEQIGQILHLLGARPKWKANGQLNGFEIIPPEELCRPRIDVHIRVSGITRDCFPGLVTYVDSVIQAVAALDEPPEQNYVRKHIFDSATDEGADPNDPATWRRMSYRIFCAQPGTFKAGVNLAIYASAWKTEKDLSDIYLFWNGYAYGGADGAPTFGVPAHKELVESLKTVEVTFDKHISDEADFLNCCCFFANYGGMTTAVHTLSGKKPKTYYGDTRDPARVDVTDFADEMRRVVRAKLLNPKYIEGMKAHGYKGAGDMSKRIGRVYGFAATTGEVDDWIFDKITETFVLDEKMREWFKKVNPWALEEVGRRLLEAQAREIWKPTEELLEKLKDAYLEVEADLEETLSDVTGEYQGGSIDIMNADDVGSWKEQMNKILGPLGLGE